MPSDVFESGKEASEVRVVVKLLDFGQRRALHSMSLPEFDERRRLDRALKMQMELSLRKRYQKWPGQRGERHSRDCRGLRKAEVNKSAAGHELRAVGLLVARSS